MLELDEHVRNILPVGLTGRVTRIVGLTVSVAGFPAPLGAIAKLEAEQGTILEAEVIGFSGEETLLLPYGELNGIRRGTRVNLGHSVQGARVGEALLGRIINGRGKYLDGLPPAILPGHMALQSPPVSPMQRPPIDTPLATGVRTIDGFLTCGRGQRLGIFPGSGAGKSTLLGQIARSTQADVNVVVLIGERGREVREFIERELGTTGLSKSVVVVATGDDPAVLRFVRRTSERRLPSIFAKPDETSCWSWIASLVLRWLNVRSAWQRVSRLPRVAIPPASFHYCLACSNEAGVPFREASRDSIRFSSKGTIRTNQFPMRFEESSTVTLFCPENWLSKASFPRSTCWRVSRD